MTMTTGRVTRQLVSEIRTITLDGVIELGRELAREGVCINCFIESIVEHRNNMLKNDGEDAFTIPNNGGVQ